jgi:hypothetical protein
VVPKTDLWVVSFMVLEPPVFEGAFPVKDLDQDVWEGERGKGKEMLVYCYAQRNLMCKSATPVISDIAQE